jgi:hypothetical protein
MRPNIGMNPAIERTINIEQENNDCSSPKKLFRVVRPSRRMCPVKGRTKNIE